MNNNKFEKDYVDHRYTRGLGGPPNYKLSKKDKDAAVGYWIGMSVVICFVIYTFFAWEEKGVPQAVFLILGHMLSQGFAFIYLLIRNGKDTFRD